MGGGGKNNWGGGICQKVDLRRTFYFDRVSNPKVRRKYVDL